MHVSCVSTSVSTNVSCTSTSTSMSTHVYKEGFLLRVVYFFSLMQRLLVRRAPTVLRPKPFEYLGLPRRCRPPSAIIGCIRLMNK